MSFHSLSPCDLRNPKRDKQSRIGRSGWYEYYAGFSPTFVSDALSLSNAKAGVSRILDPWNGGGTTTETGFRSGFDVLGFDLNPVMVLVAKSRTLQPDTRLSVVSLLDEILLRAAAIDVDSSLDPLTGWFCAPTASFVRCVELAMQIILIDSKKCRALGALPSLAEVSSLAAFFYVALFRSIRHVLKPFRSSNPTWIRGAKTRAELIRVTKKEFTSILRRQVGIMASDLAHERTVPLQEATTTSARIDVANSLALPIEDKSVQLVVTSPPYCTRIDYVIKTAPELALMGVGQTDLWRSLRESMIGTPTVAKQQSPPIENWGPTCLRLLDAVDSHASRASKSYYLKTQLQYFDALYRSLVEIDRTLDANGECFFVVQDSHYKEIRIDLAQVILEMTCALGWRSKCRWDFPSSRTMVNVNRKARRYNDPPKTALESVLYCSRV